MFIKTKYLDGQAPRPAEELMQCTVEANGSKRKQLSSMFSMLFFSYTMASTTTAAEATATGLAT